MVVSLAQILWLYFLMSSLCLFSRLRQDFNECSLPYVSSAIPTKSPPDLSCLKALIGERFLLIVRLAKPDGASRTSARLELMI